MPKELIYSRETLTGDPGTAVVEHIAVGWTKNRTVQLGVINGPKAQIMVDGKPLEEGLAGLWMDLDRDGCNRLIQSVRKARDAAYGPDA